MKEVFDGLLNDNSHWVGLFINEANDNYVRVTVATMEF